MILQLSFCFRMSKWMTSPFCSGDLPCVRTVKRSAWQQELSTRGETVTYKFKKDNYYVISGINPNGYEFYHKVFFYLLIGWSSK
jgi:hypothetical protein